MGMGGLLPFRRDSPNSEAMDQPEVIASAIYDEARLSPFEAAKGGAFGVARRLGIDVYEQPHAREEATTGTWGGVERIVLREGLQLERANFLVAQMIGRIYARNLKACGIARERSIAAWLVAPPVAFAERYDQVGADIGALSKAFGITRTAAALRLTEVELDRPYDLVVVPANKPPIRRCRGLLGQLPDADLRSLASKRTTRSVRKVQLRDDGAAVALVAS
jgi:hypothetical protein